MNAASGITVEWTMKLARTSDAPKEKLADVPASRERIPRVARLMALAIKFDRLIREGVVRDYADVARLGHVSRARVTQIMNLMLLAPDIQEELLQLPNAIAVSERGLRQVISKMEWPEQRRLWRTMFGCREVSGVVLPEARLLHPNKQESSEML